MTITRKKAFDTILENIKNYHSLFLIGCSECATLCGTGGEDQLREMKESLEANGKTVTGLIVAKTGCQVLGTKLELKPFRSEMEKTDCILVMSCGAGTQTAVELYEDKAVYPANDTLFLGNMTRLQIFDERCSMCGECILDKTGGICPVTACPKGILNGPCGGCNDGACEINPELRCAWVKIYERIKKLDRLDDFAETVIEPKDWSAGIKPRALSAREKKEQ